MRHRDMSDAARPEKALVAGKGAVDELVDDDKIARGEILAQAADRGQGNDVGHAAALQSVDIGAKVDRRGRQDMAAPMPRHKHDRLSDQRPEAELVGGRPERAVDPSPGEVGEAVDLVETAAADNADDSVGHSANPRW